MTTRAAFRSSCLLLAVASVGLGGCTSPDDVSFNAIKGDLTPHIVGLTERDVDPANVAASVHSGSLSAPSGRAAQVVRVED